MIWLFLLKAIPALIAIAIGGALIHKCNGLINTYDEIRIKENQKKEREKAQKEAKKVREKDFDRIHELKTKELTLEEKHKLLQEIGTK